MKQYEKYKPSGIEWLGDIPEHWEVKRVKDAAQICNGKSQIDVYTDDETRYPIYGSGGIMGYATDFIYKKASLLLGRKGTIDKPIYVVNPFWTIDTMFYTKINDKSVVHKYFYYSSLIFPFKALSTNTALPSMTQQSLSLCQICFPPFTEQTAIANYLDTKTAAIDRKIELLTAKADKYKSLRRSLINETVCRGLNPNAPLKDSGIEWIGMIPAHWEVKRMKDIFCFAKGKNASKYSQEYVNDILNFGIYPVYSGQTDNNGVMAEINTFDYDLQESILLVTTVGAKAMETKLITGKFSLSQNCATIKLTKKRNDIRYLYYFISQLFVEERKTIPTIMQPSLRIEDLNKYFVLLPEETEQMRIAIYLEEQTTQIDAILTNISEQITKLTQLRKTLINDVVTGKIKVTE